MPRSTKTQNKEGAMAENDSIKYSTLELGLASAIITVAIISIAVAFIPDMLLFAV